MNQKLEKRTLGILSSEKIGKKIKNNINQYKQALDQLKNTLSMVAMQNQIKYFQKLDEQNKKQQLVKEEQ